MRSRLMLSLLALAVAVTAAAVLAAGAGARGSDVKLGLIAYSTPKTVMGKIIQAFQKTPDGSGVSFTQSYGASTDQARAVAAGLDADIVFLSTGDDVNLLVDKGLVDANWDKQSYNGLEAKSVVVFAVRPGQPEAHQELERSGPVGHPGADAEPVQLGVGEMEHPRGVRCRATARQDRQAGNRIRPEPLQERRLAGHLGA